MWLHQDAIDNVDVDRSTVGSSNGLKHCGQTQVATSTKNAICRTNNELRRAGCKCSMRQPKAIQFAMDELTYHVIMQPLGYDRVGNPALDILIDGQVQIRKQLHLADQNEIVVLGEIFKQ